MNAADQQPPADRSQGLSIERLGVTYREVTAIDDVSLEIERGEFIAFLGPSGSGKTTILMSIAGFTKPTSGDIKLDGRSILDMPPEDRGIGVVFQGYALFPHLTAAQNIAFPLEMRKVDRSAITTRVSKILDMVGLGDLGGRYPHEMSGGQQQRVALARALVFEPSLLLLDEPLGALDKDRRLAMQQEFRSLHKKIGATIIYVTHDQHEALSMADRIALMDKGRIAQVGTPSEIFSSPASRFVAGFIGECNFLKADTIDREEGGHRVSVAGYAGHVRGAQAAGGSAALAIRPHHAFIAPHDSIGVPATVSDVMFLGELTEYITRLSSGEEFRIRRISDKHDFNPSIGDHVKAGWEWDRCRLC